MSQFSMPGQPQPQNDPPWSPPIPQPNPSQPFMPPPAPQQSWSSQPPIQQQAWPSSPGQPPLYQQAQAPSPSPVYQPPVQSPSGQQFMNQQAYAPQSPAQPFAYAPMQAGNPMMAQQIVNVNIQQKQHGFLMRALYFIFIGWWAGFFWLNVGYFFCFTVIGLPLGLVMLNRLPTVLTLRPASQSVNVSINGNTTNITIGGAQQYSFLMRALYFVLVGWWAGYFWAVIGWALCMFLVTMPVGLMMLNRLPAVITLRRN